MVTDQQVRRYRRKRGKGLTQEAAAAAAGMSAKTARKWDQLSLPSGYQKLRRWRTRRDPLAGSWDEVIVPLLLSDDGGELEATTLLEVLKERKPGSYSARQLRTLQRRLRAWRAQHGPGKEVYFQQTHVPGREAQIDFTHCKELKVSIAGEPFPHLFFECVMSYSGWRWIELAFGETFEALSSGLQGAFWGLGASPAVVRSDNLSAATHELRKESGRKLTQRFADLLDHYGVDSTRIRPGKSNENGVAEKAHDVLKSALLQGLLVRGHRDFRDVASYLAFAQDVVRRLNASCVAGLEEERPFLKPLPSAPVPAFTDVRTTVRKWSTIQVLKRTYSVNSRLIGHEVVARVHPNEVELRLGDKTLERMPRLRGDQQHRIDYRHVIEWLVRKPGAFARYRYREDMFPTLVFRRAYDALVGRRGERADVEYLRILQLAATTMESRVATALQGLLDVGKSFDYQTVQRLVVTVEYPQPPLMQPLSADPGVFDDLLTGECYAQLNSAEPVTALTG